MEHIRASKILLLFFAFLVFIEYGLIAIMIESKSVRNLSYVLICLECFYYLFFSLFKEDIAALESQYDYF